MAKVTIVTSERNRRPSPTFRELLAKLKEFGMLEEVPIERPRTTKVDDLKHHTRDT